MEVKLMENGTDCVLIMGGRLDTNTANEMDKIFTDVAGRFFNVTLDIADLAYISSSGLRLILRLHVTLNKKGGQLLIKNASASVMEVFEMVGFTTFCNFV